MDGKAHHLGGRPSVPRYERLSLRRWKLTLHVAYTAAVAILLTWNLHQVKEYVREQAHRELLSTLAKGESLSDWAIGHGGVYVPTGGGTRADPFLSFLPERDIVTPTGRKLTLVNPAKLLNQYYGTADNSDEVRGKLTSLRPINPDNRPDGWESQALEKLEPGGNNIVEEVTPAGGGTWLRMLKPMYVEPECLKCHEVYGHRQGEVAGAVSLRVPLDTQYAQTEYATLLLGYGILWIMGMAGIGGGGRALERRIAQRDEAHRAVAVQEHRIRTIVEGSLDAIITIDRDGFITGWNLQAARMFGWMREEAVGRPFASTILADNAGEELGSGTGDPVSSAVGRRAKSAAIHRNGRRFPIELSVAALDSNDSAVFAAFVRNITEQVEAEEKIRRDYVSQQAIAGVLELSIEPISFQEQLEKSLELVLATPWLSIQAKGAIFLTGDDGETLLLAAQRGLSASVRKGCDKVAFGKCICGRAAARRRTVFADRIDERHDQVFPDMEPHGHYCLPILSGDALLGVLTLYVDEGHLRNEDEEQFLTAISHTLGGMIQRHRAEEQLRYAAFYDGLTGLPNRSLFMDRLGHTLKRQTRQPGRGFAVLYIDLDRFKNINDSLGHSAGDHVLREVAGRLLACVRPGDTVSRLGGDEYTVLLDPVENAQQALTVTRRIHRELQRPVCVEGSEVFATASIGVAMAHCGHHNDGADLLREADTAMYQAKRLGTAQTAVFDEPMHHHAVELLTLETEVRRAVEREEFKVFYQPVVCTVAGELLGFEALVRWRHPERGLISPAQFIPIAEETGLINAIGRSVLHQTCRQLRRWHGTASHRRPYASVNLSATQFMQRDLLAQVDEALAESDLPAAYLALEVTESVLITDPAAVGRTLSALKERGVSLYIDDFGTGYSSLSYLHAYPFDSLKIDRSFTAKLTDGEEHLGIVQAVMAIAGHLGMDVIAEGVEDRRQLELLRSLGCRRVQGFHFAAPLPPEEAVRWIDAQSQDNPTLM